MDNKLTVKDFLQVFDFIRSRGERHDHKFQLGDMQAWHDYDGYTCWLGFKDVTVTLMFHGSLKIDYRKEASFEEFTQQCLALNAHKLVH
ncbi:DUF3081 family protein [Vibrio sp. SCSIO 43136]|uniref:DUF3081 family protein n=1 Tax=Vibrio sp. SCSIO 43136 TaxID=2819101 RepID=UPI00207532C8|nr:DUF3081 family protein [Vibrio sp. SCSIO 43136]USD67381.1 DUF3081 domain-containing protein [Vibrio sp. SCSIO 43136]